MNLWQYFFLHSPKFTIFEIKLTTFDSKIQSRDQPAVAAEVVGVEYLEEDEVEVAVATSSLSVERLRPNLCLTELSMLTSRLRLFWKSGRRPVGHGSARRHGGVGERGDGARALTGFPKMKP